MAQDAGNRALFCDLVGTLVAMDETRQLPLGSNGSIVIKLLPGVKEKLAPMRDRLIFVVSNQAGIKRGRYTREQVEDALAELDRQLDGILTAAEICPHDDADGCACRKPKGGMITRLADDHGVDLQGSIMVGDQAVDEQAARAAGVGQFIYAAEFFAWR
ncbi:MAG TPA: HAD-IIIA family hydrolase [Candidatus Binataceae bacterium]|nr:HAD-IIIA family hydrolase [Candidatus Binataceae bacterium]